LLNYLGQRDSAAKIERAIEQALLQKTIVLRPDGSTETNTQAVAEAIYQQLSA
jgi:isocitrate/isopropylmalate dehydrogenase